MERHSWGADRVHHQVQEEQEEGDQDVRGDHLRVRCLLAALPHLLPLLLPQPRDHEVSQHQEHLPWLLLAGHGELRCQPYCKKQFVKKCLCYSEKTLRMMFNNFMKVINHLTQTWDSL